MIDKSQETRYWIRQRNGIYHWLKQVPKMERMWIFCINKQYMPYGLMMWCRKTDKTNFILILYIATYGFPWVERALSSLTLENSLNLLRVLTCQSCFSFLIIHWSHECNSSTFWVFKYSIIWMIFEQEGVIIELIEEVLYIYNQVMVNWQSTIGSPQW